MLLTCRNEKHHVELLEQFREEWLDCKGAGGMAPRYYRLSPLQLIDSPGECIGEGQPYSAKLGSQRLVQVSALLIVFAV